MKVEIIDYTKEALDVLVYTKETRLQGTHTLDDVKDMPNAVKMSIYKSMTRTIQSPFEFVDFTFKISGVSRSFTHQLVRTRNASYAQESLRASVATQGVYDPTDGDIRFEVASAICMGKYTNLIEDGFPYQVAREVLPSGAKTSILAKIDLRELGKMAEVRLCTRTAGEYQKVFKLMKEAVVAIYPWLETYIEVYCVKYGTCCFPDYHKCPVRDYTIEIDDEDKAIIKQEWESCNHVADPSIR